MGWLRNLCSSSFLAHGRQKGRSDHGCSDRGVARHSCCLPPSMRVGIQRLTDGSLCSLQLGRSFWFHWTLAFINCLCCVVQCPCVGHNFPTRHFLFCGFAVFPLTYFVSFALLYSLKILYNFKKSQSL